MTEIASGTINPSAKVYEGNKVAVEFEDSDRAFCMAPSTARKFAQAILQAAAEAGDNSSPMQVGLSILDGNRVALTTTEWTRCITMSGEGAIELGMMLMQEGQKLTGGGNG